MLSRVSLALVAGTALAAAATAETTAPSTGMQFVQAPADAVLSYNLVGLDIFNGANENVGEIKDLVVANNKLEGYILSVGGFLGIGEHYVLVSPSSVSVHYDADKRKWTAHMNATKDQLKSAPEFKYVGRWKTSS